MKEQQVCTHFLRHSERNAGHRIGAKVARSDPVLEGCGFKTQKLPRKGTL
jgi:hypothetical protein